MLYFVSNDKMEKFKRERERHWDFMKNKSGITKRQSALEKSVGKWVAIDIIGNGTKIGFLREVNGREITLNPYQGWRYNPEHDCNLNEVVNEDAYAEISPNGYFIQGTNTETVDYNIKLMNEQIIKGKKNQNQKNN